MPMVRCHARMAACGVLLALIFGPVASGEAQMSTEVLRGTWSGSWQPDGRYDAATVRFFVEEGSLTGELANPEPLEFTRVTFDGQALTVVAEGRSGAEAPVRLEARLEEETRLNGTLAVGDVTGEVRLVKWTFRP